MNGIVASAHFVKSTWLPLQWNCIAGCNIAFRAIAIILLFSRHFTQWTWILYHHWNDWNARTIMSTDTGERWLVVIVCLCNFEYRIRNQVIAKHTQRVVCVIHIVYDDNEMDSAISRPLIVPVLSYRFGDSNPLNFGDNMVKPKTQRKWASKLNSMHISSP